MWWCFLVLRGEIIKKICCQKWRVTVARPKLRAHLCDGLMAKWRAACCCPRYTWEWVGWEIQHYYTQVHTFSQLKKKSTGGWVCFENSPSRRNETKNWNSKCYAGRWELCSLWSWPYICMLTIEIFLRQLKKNIVYCEFTFHLQSQSGKKNNNWSYVRRC
jgi:hypothetical protein